AREEKYKAKQAIDTFFVRGGDVLSAAVVYLGTSALRLDVSGFAAVNVLLTLVWLCVAVLILRHHRMLTRRAPAALLMGIVLGLTVIGATPARAQDTRDAELAAEQATKAAELHPYEPTVAEARIIAVEQML